MPRPLLASIIVIGDEILGGFVQDTNSGWLAARLHAHGVTLSGIITVPDDIPAIEEALQRELHRGRPRLVLTTGGIGSTPDDLTYEAVARGLGRELQVEPEMARRIGVAVSWTQGHGLDVDKEFVDHLMRMARVPTGATLLRRSGGWTPGVRVDVDGGVDAEEGATIVILPGVPSELQAIFQEVAEPELLAGRGQRQTVAELAHGFPESLLNRCFARLAERYPDVRIGSYPGMPMLVRLRGRPEQVAPALAYLRSYIHELESEPGGQRLQAAWTERQNAAERERITPAAEDRA